MLNLDKSTWRRVRFGDVVRNVNESVKDPEAAGIDRVLGLDNLDGGELEITRWGDVADGTTFTRRVRPGQTLFGKRRAYQRKTAYATFDAICSGDILVFEPTNQEVLLPELLPFLAMTDAFYDHALGTSAGSLSPRTKWADLAKFEFDLPPLDEQRRTADLLWAVERRARACGRLAESTSGVWELRRAQFIVNPSFQRGALGEVCTVRAGATPNRSRHDRYFRGGTIPWVKTLDLNESTLRSTDESITAAALAETSCHWLPEGTVLIAMYGGFGQIGRTAVLGMDAATNQAVSALTNLDPELLPAYVQTALQALRPAWRRVAASSRKDPNITKADIERFRIPIPPLVEQQRLLTVRGAHDHALSTLTDEMKRLKRLQMTVLVHEGAAK